METPVNDSLNFLPETDPAGSVAYAATFRHYTALKVSSAALLVSLVACVGALVFQATRPPKVLVVRLDDAGRAEAIHYNASSYTPREAEIRTFLNSWATERYRLLKAVVDEHFKQNYFFMESGLVRRLLAQDAARVATAQTGSDEQDVQVNKIEFTRFDNRRQANGAVGTGEVVIDLYKIQRPGSDAPERQHWTINLQYTVNPEAAAKRGAQEPLFQLQNPLGLTITWFHEDRSLD